MDEILHVDEKGRIQVPKKIRERLRIKRTVRASLKGHRLILESEEDPLKELAKVITTRFTDLEKELPGMRKAAEKELLREMK